MDPQQGPPPADLLIGQTIGNYLVIQKLGEGGMGSVYLAEHPQIGKKVALKVLHAEFSANEDVTKRFFNEARAVNDIGHPNIVDIVDYGVIQAGASRDKLVYFIMEYLQGGTLSDVLRKEAQPMPPDRALGIAMQVADALAASHKMGIVHRDLKPDNIMLQQRGRERDFVKLLDFGIAKLTGDAQGSSRTRTGIVMGTPAYMSPEQCEGRGNVDMRTDVYALGIVLYEMLTGRVPFIGEGYGEILVQHLTQRPIPVSQFRMMSPHVEAVVMKALEKRPEMRFPTMDEMMRAMADPVGFVEGHGGIQTFMQTQLMPSSAPIPNRMTPAPFTPVPGTLQQPSGIYNQTPSGIYPGATPAPTTLGAAAGQVTGKKSRAPFLIAGILVVAGAGAGIAIVMSGKSVESGGTTQGSGDIGSNTAGSNDVVTPPLTGSGDKTVDKGSAATGSGGSAVTAAGSGGSAVTQVGSAGSAGSAGAGSAVVVPEVPKVSVLTFTTTPAGASIWIDGVDTKKKTPEPVEVPRDKHAVVITFKLDKYEDVVLKNFSVDGDVTDKFPMKKKSSSSGQSGKGNTGKGNTGTGKGSGSGKKGNDTGLERPDDL
jgi:serine/threonine-protein kinase